MFDPRRVYHLAEFEALQASHLEEVTLSASATPQYCTSSTMDPSHDFGELEDTLVAVKGIDYHSAHLNATTLS